MIEKFEGYIKRKKRHINHKVLSLTLLVIFGMTTVFLLDMCVKFKKQKELVEDGYNRSMYEMVGYVKNINMQLTKLQISRDKKIVTITLADIWREANLAKENMASLPVEQENMSNVSKFLAQLSDYSYYLIEKVASVGEISKEDYENIYTFSDYSSKLFNITSSIYDDLNSGRIKWNEVEKIANKGLGENSDLNIYSISKTFQDYAGLIYDGAFSEHILDIKPKMLKGSEITYEEGIDKLKSIYGENNIESLEFKGEIINRLALYQYSLKLKNETISKNIYLTKDSGYMYLMISDRLVEKENITEKQAEKIGLEFLRKLGIDNMKSTYYYKQENMITINYACMQNGVILYTDLIKVKIALDDGQVCSLEAGGYIYNHNERDNIIPNITEDEAKEVLNKDLEVKNVSLAIIPTDAKEEILVYEFDTMYKDKNYLIYINANTKQEEKILIMIETTNGTLSM